MAAIGDRLVVRVSWRGATACAEWLTRKTGRPHRLPNDEEWSFAAADRAAARLFGAR
jgi:formylglycine-generating enzyme required for sulfatase activity